MEVKKIKSTVRKITLEKMKVYLKKIGWEIHGRDHFHSFYDCEGKKVDLEFWFGSRIEKKLSNGTLYFDLSKCYMEFDNTAGWPMVSFFNPQCKDIFISFYDTRELSAPHTGKEGEGE